MTTAFRGRIEDIYPLSPVQQAMLFETLADRGSGVYIQQFLYRLTGELDPVAFRRAWETVVDRHAALRTAFVWEGQRRPVQAVLARADLPWTEADLRGLDPNRQLARARDHLAEVARSGFVLTRAPLLRLALWRTGAEEHLFAVSNHHLVLDGWSRLSTFTEAMTHYRAELAGQPARLPPAPGYREFVALLERRDDTEADRFWRRYLAGVTAATALPGRVDRPAPDSSTSQPGRHFVSLAADLTASLLAAVRQHRLTLHTVVQAAWALAVTGGEPGDVVTGMTVSGRPAELPGVESIVGPFVGTLPARVRVPAAGAAGGWLAALHNKLLEGRRYEHVPLGRVQACTELPRGRPMFDCTVDVQQFYTAQSLAEAAGPLSVEVVDGLERMTVPLVVAARVESGELAVRLDHDPDRMPAAAVAALGGRLSAVLAALAADLDCPIETLAAAAAVPVPAGAPDATSSDVDDADLLARLRRAPAHRRAAFLASLRAEVDRAGDAPEPTESEHSRWLRGLRGPRQRATTPPDPEERARLLSWAVAPRAPIPPLTVSELVERQVDRRPDAVAVRAAGVDVRYRELEVRANRLARHLRRRGVGPERLVGICLPRRVDMVVAVLAVLKAGGGYLPLDPRHPPARIAGILSDSGAALVLTDRELASLVAEVGGTAVVLDGADRDEVAAESAVRPEPAADPRSTAYVLYTSGSTGRPKGVVVEHRSVVNFVEQIGVAYRLDEDTRLLALAPLTFDVSVFDLLAGLGRGATVVLASDEDRLSTDRLQRLLARERVTVAELPPALMPLLDPDRLPDLRLVSVGGEAPGGELVERWATPRRRFVNGYGPTEATVAVTLAEVSGRHTAPPPIGRPMPNHRAYVLDEDLELVGVGVPGELYVAGPGLARGYLGQPGLTAGRFVPDRYDPDGAGPVERMYRTGDRVRWLPDGSLEFLGRVDRQLKIRGFRVEPGEVEAAARAHPGIDAAVVDAVDDGGTRHLVAWVAGPRPPDTAELRELLAGRLPPYMVPDRAVRLDRLPLSPSGKVDRQALPRPDFSRSPLAGGTPARTSAEERIVTEILGPLLGVPDVGVEDDFFALGGNSLQATQVTSRVRDAFGVEVDLVDFFRRPTAAHLAELVDAARDRHSAGRDDLLGALDALGVRDEGVPDDGVRDDTTPRAGDGLLPLSLPQERVWMLHHREPENPVLNAPLALRVRGRFDPEACWRAFVALVGRHDGLRTRFVERDGAPWQRVAADPEVPYRFVDLGRLDPASREQTARRLVGEQWAAPFQLEGGPLVRLQVLRLAADHHVVQFVAHHIVTDAWSQGNVLLPELTELYAAELAGRRAELPPPESRYPELVRAQRDWLAGPDAEADLAWWRDRLAGAPTELRLPYLQPRPAAPDFTPGYHNIRLPAAVGAAVPQVARRHGATVYMTLLAGFGALVGAMTGAEDVLLVTPIAGRTRSEWENVVGFFVNRIVLRVNLAGDPSFAELAGRVRAATAESYAHQHVPFDLLVERLGADGPALRLIFSLQNAPIRGGGLAGASGMEPMPDDSGRDFNPILEFYSPLTGKFDLGMVLRERPGGVIAGGLEYNATLLDPGTIATLDRTFATLLASVLSDPDSPLSALGWGTGSRRDGLEGQ